MKIVIRSFIPAALAFIVATVLFCLPGEDLPETDIIQADKIVHIGLFATLVSLWCLPLIPLKHDYAKLRRMFFIVASLFVAYGVLIEFIQGAFIPGRTYGVDDMVADGIGAVVGLFFSNWQAKKQRS